MKAQAAVTPNQAQAGVALAATLGAAAAGGHTQPDPSIEAILAGT